MTIKGIEVSGTIYDNEDETARNAATSANQTAITASQTATQASQTATQASQTATTASQTAAQADEKIGTLANLETTAKTNLVAAINELLTLKDVSSQVSLNDEYLEQKSTDIEYTSVYVCGKVAMVLFPFHFKAETPLYSTLLTGLPKPKSDMYGLMRCVVNGIAKGIAYKLTAAGHLELQGESSLPQGSSCYSTFVYLTD